MYVDRLYTLNECKQNLRIAYIHVPMKQLSFQETCASGGLRKGIAITLPFLHAVPISHNIIAFTDYVNER